MYYAIYILCIIQYEYMYQICVLYVKYVYINIYVYTNVSEKISWNHATIDGTIVPRVYM